MPRREQLIKVTGSWGANHNIIALGDYVPYWSNRSAKIVNPRFDQEYSGRLLSLKSPEHKRHQSAIKFFANCCAEFLGKHRLPNQVDLVIVPSHERGKVSPGLIALAKEIASKDRRVQYRHNILVRTKTIDKLAHGGPRSADLHFATIDLNLPLQMAPAIVLDDILTSGNSIAACMDILKGSNYPVLYGLALGRTSND